MWKSTEHSPKYYTLFIFRMTQPLGQGHFGLVNRGLWQGSMGMISEVAIKTILPTSPAVEKIKLLQEAAVMTQFNHPNVIQLHGVVMKKDQVCLHVVHTVLLYECGLVTSVLTMIGYLNRSCW